MRSRTFREGSVGILILVGLGVFGLVVLWLNRFTSTRNSYKVIVEFANAGGMQKGAPVRYRGVKIGAISAIRPGPNAVEVEIEIAQSDLIIPKDVVIEANQSGLISESIIEITPQKPLSSGVVASKPLDPNCDRNLIICSGSRLKGDIGISLDRLVRSSTDLATTYNNPKFYQNVNKLLENSSVAASSVTDLTRDLRGLTKNAQTQLGTFSATANTVQQATNQLTASSTKTLDQFGTTAKEFRSTAKQFTLTASQANRLLTNLDNLVTSNRSGLLNTLDNISKTSNKLLMIVNSFTPAVNRLSQGELLKNLETLSANAAEASANLRDASKALNDPNNLVLVQKTLDSARATFENTQKITADLDHLTGDPTFRENLRRLVNGLSKLVSSTDQMQQQVQVATTLDSLKAGVITPDEVIPTPTTNQQPTTINLSSTAIKSAEKEPQPIASPVTPNLSQEVLLKQLREYGEQRKKGENQGTSK
ncbi:MAG: MlaD family protein [Gloeotrichia echinulata HAB0833]